jgi:rod shape determining protein RodA
VLLALAMIAAPAVLTVRQPDLGSGLLLAGIGLGIMMLAGVSLWYFAAGFTAVGVALPFLLTHLHGYQRRRIEVFLDPERDPLGAGYHIAQARIALGAGGLHGQGYLQGTQSQLDFLPEKMTDFIFVAIAEEWGFIGGAAVLALYAVIVISLFGMALRSRTLFSRLVISGAAIMLSMYVIINIAMVTGLVPVVGIPLPLVSYGGTSMLTMMVALGIAMSAHAGRN